MVKRSFDTLLGRLRLRKPYLIVLIVALSFLTLLPPAQAFSYGVNTPPPGYSGSGPFKMGNVGRSDGYQGSVNRNDVFAKGLFWSVFINSTTTNCVIQNSADGITWTHQNDTGLHCEPLGISVATNDTTIFIARAYSATTNQPLALSWSDVTPAGANHAWFNVNIGPAKTYMQYRYPSLGIRWVFQNGQSGTTSGDSEAYLMYDWFNGTVAGPTKSNEYVIVMSPTNAYATIVGGGNYTLHTSANQCGWGADIIDMGQASGPVAFGDTMYLTYSQSGVGACNASAYGRRMNYLNATALGAEETMFTGPPQPLGEFLFSRGNGVVTSIFYTGTLYTQQSVWYTTRTDAGATQLPGSWSPLSLIASWNFIFVSNYPELDNATGLYYIWNQDTANGSQGPGITVIIGSGSSWTNYQTVFFPMGGPSSGGYATVFERNNSPRYAASADRIWTTWTFYGDATGCHPSCENDFGMIDPTTTPAQATLFTDDFLYSNQYLSSQWQIDKYSTAPLSLFTQRGYLWMNGVKGQQFYSAYVSGVPAFVPAQTAPSSMDGTIQKVKLTVTAIPFAQKLAVANATLKASLTHLITAADQFPGSTPYGTPNLDVFSGCTDSGVFTDNSGNEYIGMDNTGAAFLATCGIADARNSYTIGGTYDPTAYTVFTLETRAVYCSICPNAQYAGTAWVYGRIYQETTSGTIINDASVNVTTNVNPFYSPNGAANIYASLSVATSGSATTTTRFDVITFQNYGSPVCLVCTIPLIPPTPSITSGFPGILAYLANFFGGGNIQLGGQIFFFLTIAAITGISAIISRSLTITATFGILVLAIFTYAALIPTYYLIGMVILVGFLGWGIMSSLLHLNGAGGSGGEDD